MNPQLSILIPTIKRHSRFLSSLRIDLNYQILKQPEGSVEVLIDDHETDSIGTKRNRLLERARGKYVAFFDADDQPGEMYIQRIMEGVEKDVDCCSLRGVYSEDGIDEGIFEHSIKYGAYKTNANAHHGQVKYERYPNHLNCIKSEIAKQFKFPETSWGEDTDWATQIHKAGVLKTEYEVPEIIYYYHKLTK